MPNKNKQFIFEISLSILNHLGRNLYRNFITVLGEAISNAWDADAKNVWIYLDKDNGNFVIKDDGYGMTPDDFQSKFLRVGYSKRKDGEILSPNKRPYIGAKGIGKLALLSCAEKVSIISKTKKTDYTGGVIDNSGLNEAIKNDLIPDEYPLGNINIDLFKPYTLNHDEGTIIIFEQTKENIKNTIPHLKKLIALYFRFSLVDSSFNIFVNDDPVTLDDIKDLSDSTEFLWNINNLSDPYFSTLSKLKSDPVNLSNKIKITAFIATVEKPRYLKIAGTEEKVGIDLFVNGRLREKDILKHLPDFSTRYIASYLYGQIHFNELDQDGKDRFGTSREGIVPGDQKYKELIECLKNEILNNISIKWDELRLNANEDGDDENGNKTLKERRALSLYNLSSKDYSDTNDTDDKKVKIWLKELRPEAEFNIPAYVYCFISENLLRSNIREIGSIPVACSNLDPSGKTCTDRYDLKTGSISRCEYCKGEWGKESLRQQKIQAGTSIKIRTEEDDILMYLDYVDLANITNDKILKIEDKPYKPLRNSVMHTSRLTDEAKIKLTSIFHNVVATVKKLIKVSAGKKIT